MKLKLLIWPVTIRIFMAICDGEFGLNIARRIGSNGSQTYKALNYFEELGLIEKKIVKEKYYSKKFSEGGRKKEIFLTDKGRKLKELLDNIISETDENNEVSTSRLFKKKCHRCGDLCNGYLCINCYRSKRNPINKYRVRT